MSASWDDRPRVPAWWGIVATVVLVGSGIVWRWLGWPILAP